MPNGVQLSDDKKVLMVSEALRFRISWIDTNTWTRTHIQYIPGISKVLLVHLLVFLYCMSVIISVVGKDIATLRRTWVRFLARSYRTVSQRLTSAATFFRSSYVHTLSRVDGPRHSLHNSS